MFSLAPYASNDSLRMANSEIPPAIALAEQADSFMVNADRRLLIRDSHEASACLQSLYSANQLRLVGQPQDFAMQLRFQELGKLEMASLCFGTEVQLEQAPLQQTILISTQVQGWAQIKTETDRREGGAGLVTIDPLDAKVSKRFSADSRRIHVRVPYAALESKCAEMLGRRLQHPLTFAPFVTDGAHRHWLNLLHVLLGYLDSPPTIASRAMAQALEEMVLITLLSEQPHNYRDALNGAATALAPRHVRRAEEYMREHAARPVTLTEVAEAVGVSVRTLSDGFQRARQQSPMQFLCEFRLSQVHAALLVAEPGTSVTEIAECWGFNHPGRFAKTYRARFGVLPSETLRQVTTM